MTLMKLLGLESYTTDKKKTENYMSQTQKNHFKVILRKWKEHLSQENTSQLVSKEIQAFSDLNDRASYESELASALRKQARDRRLISRIEQSIHTLEQGNYGFCEICDAEIGIHRLEARPVAQLCIDCKSLSEEKENSN